MNYFVNSIGRKGTLVLVVFLSDVAIELYRGLSENMVELSLITIGIFSGANVFEHMAKRPK